MTCPGILDLYNGYGKAPIDPDISVKNWFLDFSECQVAVTEPFDEKNIRFKTFRSGDNGGQNVNKVETGVRAIYIPTGLSAVSTEERSQVQNKRIAVERLRTAILQMNSARAAKAINDDWHRHTRIIRGNAVHKFKGLRFEPIKRV